MSETLIEKLTNTPEGMRLFQQERAILGLTELVCKMMDEQNVSRAELGRRLGKSQRYVNAFLGGNVNVSIRTISDVFTALGRSIGFEENTLVGWIDSL